MHGHWNALSNLLRYLKDLIELEYVFTGALVGCRMTQRNLNRGDLVHFCI